MRLESNERMTAITLEVGPLRLAARLNDSETALAIAAKLPLGGQANVWGQEVYFPVPLDHEVATDAQEEVPVGTLAYWPPGRAFCVFFGPTPASVGNEPRAYSPVNIVGEVLDDCTPLERIRSGAAVRIVAAEE
jgi:uncharacterized protein